MKRPDRMRGTSAEAAVAAKVLRKEMTPAEKVLWRALRKNRQEGFYFRRQHPIQGFIADFCCTAQKLCIEVDGGIHDEQVERDAQRTAVLEAAYRVLRFRNEEVLNTLHLVVRRIQAALREPARRGEAPPTTSPRNGGGGDAVAAPEGAAKVAFSTDPEIAPKRI